MLVTCGGFINVSGTIQYYAGVYNKNTGAVLLDMALGSILPYEAPPLFQFLENQFQGMAIDTHGDLFFSGGAGGLILVKVHVTQSILMATKIISNNEVGNPQVG